MHPGSQTVRSKSWSIRNAFESAVVRLRGGSLFSKFAYIPAYFAVTVATATVRFLSVSLLIRDLGAHEFARWSLFEPAVVALSPLALVGAHFGAIKQINQDNLSPIAVVRSLFLASQPALVAASATILFASLWLGLAWPGPLFLALLLYTEAVFLLLFSAYRASGSMTGFAVSSVLKVLALFVVLALALEHQRPSIHKAEQVVFWSFWASFLGLGAGFLSARLFHRRQFFVRQPRTPALWRKYADALRYGLPILVTGLLAMVIEYADRYVLNIYVDHSALANYVIYMKISSVLGLLVITPFGLWWPTERFREIEAKDGGQRFFGTVSALMLAVLLLGAGVLWLISGWILSWLAPGVPSNHRVVLLLLLAAVARGMAYPLNVGALKEGKTHWNVYGVLGAAVINLVLCFVLIPGFGIVGAAYATVLSYACYTTLLTLISQRIHPVTLPYLTMAGLMLATALLLFVIGEYLSGASMLLKTVVFAGSSVMSYTLLVLPALWGKHAR